MNITIQKEVHASTNPYRTVCNLPLTKKCKPTGDKITCPTCAEREQKRFKDIQVYIAKLLGEVEEGQTLSDAMWHLVGYVEGGLRL